MTNLGSTPKTDASPNIIAQNSTYTKNPTIENSKQAPSTSLQNSQQKPAYRLGNNQRQAQNITNTKHESITSLLPFLQHLEKQTSPLR